MCEGETSAQLSQPFCAWQLPEMLKTTLHKRAKVCKIGRSERKK